MSFEPIVNIASIKDNIAYQYSGSTNLINYISVLLSPFDELEEVFADILNKRLWANLNTDSLNIWGKLVVQIRDSYDTTEIPFFGLDPDGLTPIFHKGLGDLDNTSAGGIFRDINQAFGKVSSLSDKDYRDVIKGKIHKNHFKGGTENVISAIEAILGITEPGSFEIREIFTDSSDPHVSIDFKVGLTAQQQNYLQQLEAIPKPGGIRYEYTYI